MDINTLTNMLEKYDPNTTIFGVDLEDYGSERGSYDRFYIGMNKECSCTTGGLIAFFKSRVIGQTYEGYKGGDFYMDWDTAILLATYGSVGEFILDIKKVEGGIEFYSISAWDV